MMAKDEDQIRILRIYEFVGPRDMTERQVAHSIHGMKEIHNPSDRHNPVRISAVTLSEYPERLEAARREMDTSSPIPRISPAESQVKHLRAVLVKAMDLIPTDEGRDQISDMLDEPCVYNHDDIGPRCCLKDGHRPPHLFKCAGPSCPGLPWPASVLEHPIDCAAAVATA